LTGPARVIDADVHCHAPALAELAPHLDGYWRDELESVRFTSPPGVGYTYPRWSNVFGTPAVTLEQLRADVLDRTSFAILHCYYGVESLLHPYLAAALTRAANTWVREEWLAHDPRLLGTALVPPQHTEEAVDEVNRIAADSRFVQIAVPAQATEPYGSKRFWPIWRAATQASLPVAITAGGLTGTPPTPANWPSSFFEQYVCESLAFASQVNSLVFSGIFDEYPELKFVLTESGWTWLPALMWRMDWEWRAGHREVPWLQGPPSEYIRRHFLLTTQPTDSASGTELREVIEQLGAEHMLMYSSDFPHRYSADPAGVLDWLPAEQRERVLWHNAGSCYRL
jgi:predicted TIM-barrel fold metal-dependent hydrolase